MNLRWRASPQVLSVPQLDLGQMVVHVRTSLASTQVFRAIREQVRQVDSCIPVVDLRTMEDHLDRVLAYERLVGFFSILFGVLATILATVGLYAVTAYSVARVQEIGIRVALGAQALERADLGLAGRHDPDRGGYGRRCRRRFGADADLAWLPFRGHADRSGDFCLDSPAAEHGGLAGLLPACPPGGEGRSDGGTEA